jgi:CRP-like cAMP-binding protein
MAQEIARRIAPLTAAMADTTVAGHVARHFDPATAELLFPGGAIPAELEAQQEEWCRRLARTPTLWEISTRSAARAAIWQRPDVAALAAAYRMAPAELTADRLIGAILLHELGGGDGSGRPLARRSLELAAGEALIRQGQSVGEMYVVLSATAPLVVLRAAEPGSEPRQVATIAAPTVLGEIGMWRGQPAVATVMSREPNRLELLVIDAARFAALKEESGFRAATAAEVQRRLAINAGMVGTLLDDTAARTGSPLVASIAQLVRYLSGDSHVSLDAVVGLADEATPAECVEALRKQVDEAVRAGGLPADLERSLEQVVATIG